MSVNGTHVEDKMRRFKGECEHFSFNMCPIYTHDGASAKFSTNSHETDNSAGYTKVPFPKGTNVPTGTKVPFSMGTFVPVKKTFLSLT